MSDSWTVAVYGATGALGKEVRVGLEGQALPLSALVPVAGVRSAGVDLAWHGSQARVVGPRDVDPRAVDIAVMACPAALAEQEIPRLRDAGVLVIDLSGTRQSGGEPLPVVWPRVETAALASHPGGFALPCGPASTLAPIVHAASTLGALAEVDAVELAGATDVGVGGPETLSSQTVGMLSYKVVDAAPFRDVLAFNLIDLGADEVAREARLAGEMSALLPAIDARYRLMTMHVPVFSGIALAVSLRFADAGPTVDAVTAAFDSHPDLTLTADGEALRDALDADQVLLAPPRLDPDGTVRLFAYADPLHRIGDAVATLLDQVIREDLW